MHYIPLHLQPYWRDRYQLQPQQFPHSQRAYERMLSLPLYTRMGPAEVQRVIANGIRWAQPQSQVTVKPRHVPVEQAREMIHVRGGTVH